jgi:hypothetical protein
MKHKARNLVLFLPCCLLSSLAIPVSAVKPLDPAFSFHVSLAIAAKYF